MNRWILSLVVLGAVLLAGLGSFAFFGSDALFATATDQTPARQLAQLVTPPGSETKAETKPPVAAATPPAPQPAPTPGAQAAKPPAPTPAPGWAVNCKSAAADKELECRMSQTIVLKKSGRVLADVAFRIPTATKRPEIVVRLPLGAYLPAGASFKVDEGTPERLNFKVCGRNGCYAEGPISSEVLAALRKGKQLTVSFQSATEKPINVPMSLEGFAGAYDKMQKPS